MRKRLSFIQLLTRFGAARTGAAAVEFALILPIMLLVYVGTLEASSLISMDRKVQTVSGSVGDLVARSDKEIPVTTLQDYVRVAGGIMTPFDPTPLSQIVTEVLVSEDGATATVVWSRGYKGQVANASIAHAAPSAYQLPAEIRNIAKNQYVIVAETSYSYKPLYGIVFNKEVTLYRQNFYLPRFGGQITLK